MSHASESLLTLSLMALTFMVFSMIVTAPAKKSRLTSRARLRFVLMLSSLVLLGSIIPSAVFLFQSTEMVSYPISSGIYMAHIWLVVIFTYRQPQKVFASIQKMLGGKYSYVLLTSLFIAIQLLLVFIMILGSAYGELMYILVVTLNLFFAAHSFFLLTIFPIK